MCLSMNVLTVGELLRERLEISAGKNVTCVRITTTDSLCVCLCDMCENYNCTECTDWRRIAEGEVRDQCR